MTVMHKIVLIIGLLCLPALPAKAWDMLSLTAASEHQGSDVWSGKFTGLNGRSYDASAFYRPNNQPFSAKAVLTRRGSAHVTWLLPIAADAGYQARLYQAEPLLSLGTGAAIRFARHAMLSIRLDNLVRLGGDVSEQPCYDGFRRQYHCGTGVAWRDYQNSDIDRRGSYGTPAVKIKLTHRFSF